MFIKIILFALFYLVFDTISFGQGRNNIYLFGYTGPLRGTIDFISGAPVVITDSVRKSNLSLTHANISDKTGKLLFYTNGVVVLDGNHDTMQNGKGLNPCAYTSNFAYDGLVNWQGNIILPFPDDTNSYYLFHQALEYLSIVSSSQIYYSIVDLTLNNGKGDVILKNTSFFQDTLRGNMITACKHANGRDWWLVVPKAFYPIYYLFLITPMGVQYSSTQMIGQRYYSGQGAFSPDGNHWGFFVDDDGMDIFDFDRSVSPFNSTLPVIP